MPYSRNPSVVRSSLDTDGTVVVVKWWSSRSSGTARSITSIAGVTGCVEDRPLVPFDEMGELAVIVVVAAFTKEPYSQVFFSFTHKEHVGLASSHCWFQSALLLQIIISPTCVQYLFMSRLACQTSLLRFCVGFPRLHGPVLCQPAIPGS